MVLLTLADMMWVIHESSAVGIGVQQAHQAGQSVCKWDSIDQATTRVEGG